MTKVVKLIDAKDCAWVRELVAAKDEGGRPSYGSRPSDGVEAAHDYAEAVVASGRATCRECGKRIAKGAPAIRWPHDFTGNGCWTHVEVQIHRDPCTMSPTFFFLLVKNDELIVRYRENGREVDRIVKSIEDLDAFLARRATVLGVPATDLRVSCSSTVDFPRDSTKNPAVIALCHELRG